MAFRRGKKRTYRKRRVTRRRTVRRKTNLYKGVGPAGHQFMKLPYTELYQASIAANASSSRQWRLNNLYDPNATGTGYQPTYFQQMAAMYTEYIVYAVKVDCRISVASSTTNMYYPIAVITPYAGTTGWNNAQDQMSEPGSQWRWMIPGQKMANFKAYYKNSTLFGVTKKKYSNEQDYTATCTSSSGPTSQSNMQVVVYNLDGGNAISMATEMKLVYYVKFYNIVRRAHS